MPRQSAGGPGGRFGSGAYASQAELVSVSTSKPRGRAIAAAGRARPSVSASAPADATPAAPATRAPPSPQPRSRPRARRSHPRSLDSHHELRVVSPALRRLGGNNGRELAYIARAVAMTMRSGRMRASRSTNGSHAVTTSRANSARTFAVSSAAAATSCVLCTYCQRNYSGAGRWSFSSLARIATSTKPAPLRRSSSSVVSCNENT
jgi:hypothetical protein